MKTELIRIGNSRGVRIPKPLIEQSGLRKRVQLQVDNDCIIISPERGPREGWETAFRAVGPTERDERLLDSAGPSGFDRTEWKW
ncbi:MAG TPA: AbrB/MazE/SpoVT family DNA-binding domain-containing protein [Terriglobales bacterium]